MKEIEVHGFRYTVAEYNAEFQMDSGERMLRVFLQQHPDAADLKNVELEKRFKKWQSDMAGLPSAAMKRLERDMIFEPIGDAPSLSELMQSTAFTAEEIGTIMQEHSFFVIAASANSPTPDSSSAPSTRKRAPLAALVKKKASRSPRKTLRKTRG